MRLIVNRFSVVTEPPEPGANVVLRVTFNDPRRSALRADFPMVQVSGKADADVAVREVEQRVTVRPFDRLVARCASIPGWDTNAELDTRIARRDGLTLSTRTESVGGASVRNRLSGAGVREPREFDAIRRAS